MTAAAGWQAVAARWLIERCAGHRRQAERLAPERSLPSYVRSPATHLEPSDWGAGFVALREYELPLQLYTDLHALVPQALLRDLHRPVYPRRQVARELIEGCEHDPWPALAAARAARRLPARGEVASALAAVRALEEERRRLLATPWPGGVKES